MAYFGFAVWRGHLRVVSFRILALSFTVSRLGFKMALGLMWFRAVNYLMGFRALSFWARGLLQHRQ